MAPSPGESGLPELIRSETQAIEGDSMLKKKLNRLRLQFANRATHREYSVGLHRIRLPRRHQIDVIQQRWKRYDVSLGEIARTVFGKYPGMTAIDIGANIGDSAALICKHQDIPVLCVEGNPEFIPILRDNIERLGHHIVLEDCFVADDRTTIDQSRIDTHNGTASIAHAIQHDGGGNVLHAKSIGAILAKNPRFAQAKLLKIDTDGLDFFILRNSISLLQNAQPIVFFEYDLEGTDDAEQQSLDAMNALAEIGYRRHLIYDNFGNFLMSFEGGDKFVELNSYLKSNRRFGTAVYYFDVCSVHETDEDLFAQIRANELAVGGASYST